MAVVPLAREIGPPLYCVLLWKYNCAVCPLTVAPPSHVPLMGPISQPEFLVRMLLTVL